jgi:hypothetical protein
MLLLRKDILWVSLLALGTIVLVASLLEAQEPDKPGTALSVSAAHALFGKQCNLCHEPFLGPSEKLCLGCHAGPLHNAGQTFTPPCFSCHAEHQGQEKLARVDNGQCVTCHSDVKTKDGTPLTIEKTVTDFVRGHPEFALTVNDISTPERLRLDKVGVRQSDRSKIIFPHEKHLKPGLKSPKGEVQLACRDCHTPAADGQHMRPVTYLARCQSCHPLAFDPQYPGRVVPHAAPQEVRAYLYLTFTEHRGEKLPTPPPAPTGRLTRPVPSVSPLNPTPGVAQQVTAAEQYLYTKTCNKCHILEKTQEPFPVVAKTAIPTVWLPHARFAHKSHRMLECTACHADAAKSQKAADVLLPGIQVCRECHRAGTQEGPVVQQQNTAFTQCISCHLYHDKSGDVEWNGPFTVQRVLTEGLPKKTKTQPVPAGAQP